MAEKSETENKSLFGQFPRTFWAANIMELFERGAYYGLNALLARYLTDEVGGGRGGVNINGMRGIQNSFNIDGANNQSSFFGEERGGTRPPFPPVTHFITSRTFTGPPPPVATIRTTRGFFTWPTALSASATSPCPNFISGRCGAMRN